MATYTDLMDLFDDMGRAINTKVSNTFTYYPNQMPDAIRGIQVGSSINNQSITVYPQSVSQTYNPDSGYTGLGPVIVEAIPSSYIIPEGTYTVSSAGTFDIKNYASLSVAQIPTTYPSAYIISSSAYVSTTFMTSQSGWIDAHYGYTKGLYLPATSISHITPTTSSQVAVSQYRWTLNEVIVDAIPSNYIIPSGTSTITTNGTYDITSFASVSVAIPVGDFINNQENIVVTPTEEEQIISAAAGYTGLGPVTINGISSTYVGTGIPIGSVTRSFTSTAYRTFVNSGYYSQNIQIVNDAWSLTTPSITISNTAGLITAITSASQSGYYSQHSKSGTLQLTTQAGYTITPLTVSQIVVPSYRWTTGSVIVDAIPISTILSSAIDGQAYLEATNNYAFSATITIPEGYYSTTTITRSFSDILPSLSTQATAAQIPLGYEVYDGEGHIITGSMPVNGSITKTLDSTVTSVTIPAGYYAESGLISHTTVAIPSPTFSFNSTTRVVTASGNWTRGFTTNNSYTNTYTVSAGTVVPPSTITGTSATLTAGTNTLTFSKTISVTPNVTTAGWISAGTASNVVVSLTAAVSTRTSNSLTTSGSTVTVPAGYYATQATKNVASTTHPAPTISFNSTTGVITANHTQTAGYVTAGTTSSTMSLTTKAASTIIPTTSSQTAVAANTFVTGTITIDPIPSSYHQLSNSTTATSADIVAGETAYNSNGQLITGELQAITYYTGSTVPNSSLGSDGDIYLQG